MATRLNSNNIEVGSNSTAQLQAISSPATGAISYDNQAQGVYFYDGTEWKPITYTAPADTGNGGGYALVQGADGTNSTNLTSTSSTNYISSWYCQASCNNSPLNFVCSGFAYHTGHASNSTQWPFYHAVKVSTQQYGKIVNQIQWYKHVNACGNIDMWGSNQNITATNFNQETNYTFLGRVHMGGFQSQSDCTLLTRSFNTNSFGYQWYMLKVVDINSNQLTYPSTGTLQGWAMYGMRLIKV